MTQTHAKTAHTSVPVLPLIAERWSPRGFDRTHVLPDDALTALLEAARWAPSASNTQPWRLLPARRGDDAFDRLLQALAPGNQVWAGHASALVLIAIAVLDDSGAERRWAWYDAGQAAALLTVQASHLGYSVHQMGGFDTDAVRAAFELPASVEPIAVAAVGRWDPDADLPDQLAERERGPRERMPLEALILPS